MENENLNVSTAPDDNSTPPTQVVSVEEFNALVVRVAALETLEAKVVGALKHMGADVRNYF